MPPILEILGLVGLFRIAIYAIGDPSSEYNPKAILAKYTYALSKARLNYLRVVLPANHTIDGAEKSMSDEIIEKEIQMAFTVNECLPVAGFLNMVGFCSTCTSVWFFAFTYLLPHIFSSGYYDALVGYGICLFVSRFTFKYL
jgi:hypothetical protein